MVGQLWVPGPHDELVSALHRQITRFAERHGAALVEAELRDGSTVTVSALSAEPGEGFVTLTAAGDEPLEVIVPVAPIVRVSLRAAPAAPPPGFALPVDCRSGGRGVRHR